MITLYHLENSRSIRILWLLEELGTPYELIRYSRDPETDLAEPEFKKVHLLGKAPVISDNGRLIAESGAIIEHILDNYDRAGLRPEPGTPERIKYNYWMHAAEGSIMNIATLALVMNRFDARAPFFLKPLVKLMTGSVRESYIEPNMKLILDNMENELSGSKWFAGDVFTAADVQMGYVMTVLQARGGLDEKYPQCIRWIEQMKERPAFKSAMEKNGELHIMKD